MKAEPGSSEKLGTIFSDALGIMPMVPLRVSARPGLATSVSVKPASHGTDDEARVAPERGLSRRHRVLEQDRQFRAVRHDASARLPTQVFKNPERPHNLGVVRQIFERQPQFLFAVFEASGLARG